MTTLTIVESKRRKPAKGKKLASKAVSVSKLMKECDRLFSLKVRQLNASFDGTQKCYTCGNANHWKKLHNGHYLSRFYKSARWDKDNCRPQCMMCNLWKRGDPITFRQNLIKEIGEKRVLAVEAKRNVSFKLTREFLTNLIEELKG